jgi:hypothetical protein
LTGAWKSGSLRLARGSIWGAWAAAEAKEDRAMRVYFATNRDPNVIDQPTDFGNLFSPNGLTDLRY